jgi:hypothetical protein
MMANEQVSGSNSEGKAIGMEADSIDQIQETVANSDSTDNFFESLEKSVNGQIQDDGPHEVTQSQTSGSEQATHKQQDVGSNSEAQPEDSSGWEKRYKDSSREAVNLKEQLNDLKPFIPVLDAMKQDSGLVTHVRDYLSNGGQPSKSIQEQLNLKEDFVYDQNEAMTNPDSDSAKLMNAHVDKLVQSRVGQVLTSEKRNAQALQAKAQRKRDEDLFKKKHNMTDEQFADFVSKAKTHKLTLDGIHHLLNKEKVATNTANATRTDMLNQMKNVQNMPTSASGANSQSQPKNPDNNIFDGILSLDGGLDNLFGD